MPLTSLEQLNRGDILLYKPTSKNDIIGRAIAHFENGGVYVHSSIFDGKQQIESVLDKGVSKSDIDKKYFGYIDVFTIGLSFEREKSHRYYVDKMIEFMESQIGLKYDFLAYPETWFRSVFARTYGWKHFANQNPVTNDKKTWYCSELVASAIQYSTGLAPLPGTKPANTTPDDLRKGWLKRKF
jgi:hypothetical protein